MSETAHALIHHFKRIAEKAGAKWDSDCTAELDSLFDHEERRIASLETRIKDLDNRVEHLERHIRPEVPA
jgi:predicted  nucleic acid-binding Zn-ribbon protein